MSQMNNNKDEGGDERIFFPLSSHDYIIFYCTPVSTFDPPSSVLKPKYTPAHDFFPVEYEHSSSNSQAFLC